MRGLRRRLFLRGGRRRLQRLRSRKVLWRVRRSELRLLARTSLPPSTGASECAACAAGYFSEAGAADCSACASGKFSSASGASNCDSCPAGFASSSTGAAACSACLPGTYASGTGETSCRVTTQGTYTQIKAATSYSTCIFPYTTRTEGATNCSACVAGYYLSKPSEKSRRENQAKVPSVQNAEATYALWECKKCPEGTECGEGYAKHRFLENLHIQADYYRFSSTSSRVYECPPDYKETNCLEGNTTKHCYENSEGPLVRVVSSWF